MIQGYRRHEHLLFYSLLKWLFSMKVVDTLSGLRENVMPLPEKEERDLFDLLCDKLWLASQTNLLHTDLRNLSELHTGLHRARNQVIWNLSLAFTARVGLQQA